MSSRAGAAHRSSSPVAGGSPLATWSAPKMARILVAGSLARLIYGVRPCAASSTHARTAAPNAEVENAAARWTQAPASF